jgi:uncharacterized protein with HEPN domain
MRNRIVHEHWRADPDLIWEALTRDVPEVEARLELLDDQLERG